MNYIVFDLEWNQGNTGAAERVKQLPFEIIEIGAVKLNDDGVTIGEFSEIVKPQVYREMHHITGQLVHMKMNELDKGKEFPIVAKWFMNWCGRDGYIFCTWGNLDLIELQRNIEYYNMTPLSDGPIAFLDVQKLFGIAYEDRKEHRSLEYAIDYLQLEKEIPFHRAFSDAYYTAKILTKLLKEQPKVLKNVSYDVFHPPKDRRSEVRVQFDSYTKYISRRFKDKAQAFADREVCSTKCYICHCNLKKRIRWYSVNAKHYYAVAYCEKHGYLKAKIRIRKAEDGMIYVVKTTKFIAEQEALEIAERCQHIKEARRRRRHKEAEQE